VEVSDPLGDDLREQLARQQVVVVVGAGVSVGATGGAPTASWLGLLHDGVARCEAVVGQGLPAGWGDRVRAQIDSGDVEELLSAAENLTRRLGGPGGGEYGRWLRESVGSLKLTDPEVIGALAGLGAPIATTNYDGLIEQVAGLPAVTWRQGAQVERVVRRDDRGVVHLHGHWQDPASVVLGIGSYAAVLGDEHAQALQHALAMLESLLFVGFGAGLADPNFGALRAWLGRVLPGSQYRHFRLGRDGELAALHATHDPAERIMVLGYGPGHADLGPFLRTLTPAQPPAPDADAKVAPPSGLEVVALPPLPRCFGRDPIIADLVDTVCARRPVPVPVLGPPGIGKSTVCLAVVHQRRVVARFGERRWFVRCNAATSGAGLLADIATTLGVPPGPQRAAQTLAALAAGPGVLVLDNAETPWEADTEATEAVLGQLAAITGLRLLVTVRGAQRPFGVPWRESVLVPPLGLVDGRRVLLAVAGQRFADDPRLDELVLAQDGVPLAIELLAYLADAEPDLAGLWRRWQTKRTALLLRGSASSPQLSAEVSFELSISGPRMTAPARRLLSLLALLPDGVAHHDLDLVLPGEGEEAAWTLRRVGLAFDEGPRLRMLQPIRDHTHHHHPPDPDDLARASAHYRQLADTLGPKVGGSGGAAAAAQLTAEAGNLEVILLHDLDRDDPDLDNDRRAAAVEAAIALTEFLRFSGFGSTRILEAALTAAQHTVAAGLQAQLLGRLGDIALQRSDNDAAAGYYQQAQPLYEQVGNVLGQANCIKGLGNIALRRSDRTAAAGYYRHALDLYGRIPEPYSIGRTHRRLARLATSAGERRRHVQAARDAWSSIARADLAHELDEEFGDL
jgi:hypothetical protein